MMTKRLQLTQALFFLVLMVVAQYGPNVSAETTAAAGIDSNMAAGTADENGHALERHLSGCGCGDCSAAESAVQAAGEVIDLMEGSYNILKDSVKASEKSRNDFMKDADGDQLQLDLDLALRYLPDAEQVGGKELKAARREVVRASKAHKAYLKQLKIYNGAIKKTNKRVKKAEQELIKAYNFHKIMSKRLSGCYKKLNKCLRKCANGKI